MTKIQKSKPRKYNPNSTAINLYLIAKAISNPKRNHPALKQQLNQDKSVKWVEQIADKDSLQSLAEECEGILLRHLASSNFVKRFQTLCTAWVLLIWLHKNVPLKVTTTHPHLRASFYAGGLNVETYKFQN